MANVVVVNLSLVMCAWHDWSTTIFGGADKAASAVHPAMRSWLVGAPSIS